MQKLSAFVMRGVTLSDAPAGDVVFPCDRCRCTTRV